ncbi:MAG: peptidyl-prolyl cis-trans isomerase [Candidatus Omnitrophica bacterium]|nr:peptidyl-prolyl cis-trans isomerase [Candidatus Omnitrophota bacterium]
MPKHYKFIFFVLFFTLFATVPTHAAIEDAIVAVVNEEVITLNDLKDYIEMLTTQMRLEGTKSGDIQQFMNDMAKNGLDKLIDDKILLNAANKNEIALNQSDPKGEEPRNNEIEAMVDMRLAQIKSQYKSEIEFLNALLDQGASVTDVRNRIRNQIKTKRLVDQEIRSKIYVNPQEVTTFYKNHFENFKKPERVNLDSIFIAKKDDPLKAKTQADEIHEKIKNGEDFKTLAKQYSQSPPIGIIHKGQALPEIERIVFNLSVNETSPVCEVDNGYYIFRLIGHAKEELSSLDEVKDSITNKIFETKFLEKFDQWLNKLKKEAFVDIKKNL